MPRLMPQSDEDVINIPGPGTFTFSAKKIDTLTGATEYTLVTIVIDVSGSVQHFAGGLLDCVKSIVRSCKDHARSENLLIRFLTFNDDVIEIHGFRDLETLKPDEYEELNPNGFTALFDATYDGVGATVEYAKRLTAMDYDTNAVTFIITDGLNNRGMITPKQIKEKIEKALGSEEIISYLTLLVGLHDPAVQWSNEVEVSLKKFKEEANLSEYLSIGEASPEKLAKLANWASESVSSTSNALHHKTPSQVLQF
jgi:hypothetical protein